MSDSIQARLHQFATSLLKRHGALVEWERGEEDGVAILPEETARLLHCGEMLNLSFSPQAQGMAVNLSTDFLDRVAPLLEREGRVIALYAPELYLKRGDMAETVRRAFTWHNAKVVLRETKAVRVEYHTWSFSASIKSEDQWEEIVTVTINSASGAEVELPDPLAQPEIELNPDPAEKVASSYTAAVRAAMAAVERRSAEFLARMEMRLQRDRKRLHEYYTALLKESKPRHLKSRTIEVEKAEREAKRRVVSLELARKLAELNERYALRVNLSPLVLIRTELPALAIQCDVFRKQAQRAHVIYWNALLKQLEPLVCKACGRNIFSVIFDDEVLPLCPPCAEERRRKQ